MSVPENQQEYKSLSQKIVNQLNIIEFKWIKKIRKIDGGVNSGAVNNSVAIADFSENYNFLGLFPSPWCLKKGHGYGWSLCHQNKILFLRKSFVPQQWRTAAK